MGLHEELISAREAAKILGITSTRVIFLCRKGRFNGAEKIGAGWIIPRQSVLNHKRLPPGAKPRSAPRENDKKLIQETFNKLKETECND